MGSTRATFSLMDSELTLLVSLVALFFFVLSAASGDGTRRAVLSRLAALSPLMVIAGVIIGEFVSSSPNVAQRIVGFAQYGSENVISLLFCVGAMVGLLASVVAVTATQRLLSLAGLVLNVVLLSEIPLVRI